MLTQGVSDLSQTIAPFARECFSVRWRQTRIRKDYADQRRVSRAGRDPQ
ncbi:Uncharacterised protein [Vibrio cholerae]|nr:Uncharacterised protein [Vibrio cholerae]